MMPGSTLVPGGDDDRQLPFRGYSRDIAFKKRIPPVRAFVHPIADIDCKGSAQASRLIYDITQSLHYLSGLAVFIFRLSDLYDDDIGIICCTEGIPRSDACNSCAVTGKVGVGDDPFRVGGGQGFVYAESAVFAALEKAGGGAAVNALIPDGNYPCSAVSCTEPGVTVIYPGVDDAYNDTPPAVKLRTKLRIRGAGDEVLRFIQEDIL